MERFNCTMTGASSTRRDSDYRGEDRFFYAADDGSLISNEAEVLIDVGPPRVSIRLEVTDPTGQPVARVTNGDPLRLRAWVQDVRDEFFPARGVFAAYLDVMFDPDQVLPLVDGDLPLGFEIDFGDEFQDPGTGDVLEPGVINEVGSFQITFGPLGPNEFVLFDIPFDVAGPQAAGDHYEVSFQSVKNLLDVLANDEPLIWTTQFTADPADISPDSDVLLFEPPVVVPHDEIDFSGASVDIGNDGALLLVAVGAGQPTVGA